MTKSEQDSRSSKKCCFHHELRRARHDKTGAYLDVWYCPEPQCNFEVNLCKHNNQRQGERGPPYCADCGAEVPENLRPALETNAEPSLLNITRGQLDFTTAVTGNARLSGLTKAQFLLMVTLAWDARDAVQANAPLCSCGHDSRPGPGHQPNCPQYRVDKASEHCPDPVYCSQCGQEDRDCYCDPSTPPSKRGMKLCA